VGLCKLLADLAGLTKAKVPAKVPGKSF